MARPKRKRTIGPAEAARAKKAKTAAAAKAAKAKAAAQKAAAAEAAAASVESSESEEEDLGQGEEVEMPSRYDDMDLPALIRAVFSLPADAQPVAIVDAAVSAADVDGLRKILRDVDAAVEPTKWDGMDFASLVRAAVLLPAAHSEAADVAIRASDAEALRQLLTENHQVAPAQARAKGMDPTRDAAEIQEMMARELKRAEGAATEEAKMQHKRSAEMLRAQIGAGDGPQGDSGQAESQMTDTRLELERALSEGDTKEVRRILNLQEIRLAGGQGQAMEELQEAAKAGGAQGASSRHLPLERRPLVEAPGVEFDGMRPLLDLQKLPKVNILFPRWFHVRDADLDSALMAPPTGTGLETSGAGGELQDFTTVEEWFQRRTIAQW